MSYSLDGYQGETVALAPVSERVAFIRRTYAHLTVAILALVGIEFALLSTGIGETILKSLFAQNGAWIALMVLFIGGGYAAQSMARSTRSVGLQYAGLALYVMLQALILLPILWKASTFFPNQFLIPKAAVVTLMAFGGLTAAVFWSKKDFSFMGPMLGVLSFVALGVVICAVLFGFGGGLLGIGLSVAMIALAAGYIIYDTSNIMHQYGTNQHVAASLALFASVALMFFYVLRLFMATSRD